MSKKVAASKKGGKAKDDGKKGEEKPKVNFEELIFNNLSNPKLTLDQAGYHFVDLDLSCKSIDLLSNIFVNFKHIQNINLSGNNISDFAQLSTLPSLIQIDLSGNNIKDLKSMYNEENFKSLRRLNLSKNRVVEIQGIKAPNLTHLNLNNNLVDKLEAFEGHPKLKVLNLAGNKIQNLATMGNMPELKELYLGNNKIKQLQGLELPNLVVLNLRGNMIEQLFEEAFPNLENLTYLNIRENKLEKFAELQKLANPSLEKLKILVHSFNPWISKNPNYLFETINLLLKLTRVNKIHITKNIKMAAFSFAKQKHEEDLAIEARTKAEEEEKERLAQEEEERAAQENA